MPLEWGIVFQEQTDNQSLNRIKIPAIQSDGNLLRKMQDGSVLLSRRPPEQMEPIKALLFPVVMEDSAMKTSRCLSGSKKYKNCQGIPMSFIITQMENPL